jgi:hypothetical protein
MESPVSGEVHGVTPKCGGKNRQGKPCGNSAGYKTDHPGSGNCHFHGGSSPNGRKHAMEEQARKAVETYGLPRDISPTDALLEEVRYSAGHVAWLRAKVAELEAQDLVWGVTEEVDKNASEFAGTDTTRAAAVNMWLELYFRERKHLLDLTKTAISVGIEERRVRLAEAQGSLMNDVIRRILARLSLTPDQSRLLPVVVPEELRRAAAMASAN